MANFIPFVSQAFLKDKTPLNANIDTTELVSHIETTELVWTRELIGRPLYDDLKVKFIAQTLSADENELVGYMKMHITFRTAEMAIPFLSIKLRAKGAVKLNGIDGEAQASLSEVKYLREELKNRAEYFEKRVIDYLCLHSALFPLYNDTDDKTGIQSNGSTTYDSDIYLGDVDSDLRDNRRKGFFN